MKSLVALTAVSFMFVSSGLFAGTTWTPKSGGDLNDPDNWGGELPATDASVNIGGNQSGPLTATANFVVKKMIFGGGAMTFSPDEGVGPSVNSATLDFQTDLTLTSGNFGYSGGSLSVGSLAGKEGAETRGNDNVFTAIGSQSFLGGSGGERLYVGMSGTGNRVMILNGATAKTEPILGYNAAGVGNAVVVSGTGASLESGSHVFIGVEGGDNALVVSNGASLVTSGSKGDVLLGGTCDSKGGGEGNVFTVADAATATLTGGIGVGVYTSSNRCEISNGARVTCASLAYAGGSKHATYTKGEYVRGNVLCVSGAETVLTATQVNSGMGAGSRDSRVEVLDGATVNCSGTIYSGNDPDAVGSSFVVSNATFNCKANATTYFYFAYKGPTNSFSVLNGGKLLLDNYSVNVGYAATASDSVMTVGKDAEWKVVKANGTHYIGNVAPRCRLIVDNGKVDVAGQVLYVGNGATATGCALEVKGSDGRLEANDLWIGGYNATECEMMLDGGKVTVTGTFSLGGNADATEHSCSLTFGADGSELNAGTVNICGDSQLTFKVPKGGYSSAPFKCSTRVRCFPNTVKIKVETHKHSVGGTYPLFACCSITQMKSAQWDIPDDCELVYDDTAKVVSIKVPDKQPGLMLILR